MIKNMRFGAASVAIAGFLLVVLAVDWAIDVRAAHAASALADRNHAAFEMFALLLDLSAAGNQYLAALDHPADDRVTAAQASQRETVMVIFDELYRVANTAAVEDALEGVDLAQLHSIERALATDDQQQSRSKAAANDAINAELPMLLRAMLAETVKVSQDSSVVASNPFLSARKALAIAVVLTATVLLHRRLLRPLNSIAADAEHALSEGASTMSTLDGPVELTRITHAVNGLILEQASSLSAAKRVTSRLRTEVLDRSAQLQEANEALLRMDAVRRQFFADIGHELRTPLTVIQGEAEIGLRSFTKQCTSCQATFQSICTQASLIDRLVDDLLLVARTDAGAVRTAKQPVLVKQLIEQVCKQLRVLAQERAITLSIELERGDHLVAGDAIRLHRLVQVLVDNAIRRSDIAGEVTVNLNQVDEYVRIAVKDHSQAIAPDNIESVFERLYYGDQSYGSHDSGLGLGLAVARAIAKNHGGTLRVTSVASQGTTFVAKLPIFIDLASRTSE